MVFVKEKLHSPPVTPTNATSSLTDPSFQKTPLSCGGGDDARNVFDVSKGLRHCLYSVTG
jgi:hypothetical protein